MRNTLLTTTALVLSAGIASADGHASISWSGAATAGLAREGSAAASAAVAGVAASTTAAPTGLGAWIVLQPSAMVHASATTMTAAEIKAERTRRANAQAAVVADTSKTTAQQAASLKAYNADVAEMDYVLGTLAAGKAKAGDWKSYSEVNATVTGSVTAGNVTLTAAMSVDAGTGYDFADDDGFDAAKSNGVGLDNVTIATPMGTFKIDENAITHLVDGDDDDKADILYTNTFGSASVSVAVDANKDTDVAFVAAVKESLSVTGVYQPAVAATVQDVAWSAKVSMPLGGGSAYVAMDEEGGNIFGASTTLSGIGLTFSSKLEALDSENKADRSNTIGATYVMGSTTLGASWNSIDDGDQWGISAAYAGDDMTISASTDEGSDWSVSGSYVLGTGASVVGGVNYTEDAFLGLKFAF